MIPSSACPLWPPDINPPGPIPKRSVVRSYTMNWDTTAKAGVWERVFAQLVTDPDNDYISLDSSLVRAHQQAATGKGGGQKGGTRLWGAPEED